jgi:hypothetical protein
MAKRWLYRLGCRFVAVLPDHGCHGEEFELWAWELSRGLPSEIKGYR